MSACDKPLNRYPIPAVTGTMPHCSQLLVKRSRFLTQTSHCASAAAAREFVARIRAINPDATHNCWAFAAGMPGDTACIGSADDGEPHGTAGRPMLNALLHCGVGEICVVVSRWFGGIKLGTGGLVRAYQDAVLENLATLPLKEAVPQVVRRIVAGYPHVDALKRMLTAHEGAICQEKYESGVEFLVSLPEDRLEDFAAELARISNGGAAMEACRASLA